MKDLLNLLSREKNEDFDAIRIGLASPEMARVPSQSGPLFLALFLLCFCK